MSSHDSDNENVPSDRSDSPEQEESFDRELRQLPAHNPSNIPNDAVITDTTNEVATKKRPKMAGRPRGDEEEPTLVGQNTDTRPDGGFINPENARPRTKKMKWDDAKDRDLLIFGLGRDISTVEYQSIADWFPERPTAKAVMERTTKLRALTRKYLKETGIFDPDLVVRPSPAAAQGRPATTRTSVSPAQRSTKKARRSSTSKTAKFPPSTGKAASRARSRAPPPPQQQQQQQQQQPLQTPQGLQSFQPPPHQQPHLLQTGLQAFPTPPPAHPAGPAWPTRLTDGAPMAPMYPTAPLAGSPQVGPAQMNMPPPTAAPAYPQYPGHYNVFQGASMYPGPGGIPYPMGPYTYAQPQPMPAYTPEPIPASFTPNLLVPQPAGAAIHPAVPNAAGFVEGEEEDTMRRSERELEAKRAEREARKRAFPPAK